MVNAISTFPSFTGLAKETTYATPVAATVFTPATTIAFEDLPNYVPDTAMRGSAVESYAEYPTQKWGTFSYDCPVYMDTIGSALMGILGSSDVSGSGPYVHTFAVNNATTYQPPSYTIGEYNGVEWRYLAGSVFSQLAFSFSGSDLLTASIQGTGLASATTTKPTQSFSAKTALAAYTGAITIGGSATGVVESGSFTISRTVTPITAVNNSSAPAQIWGGAVSVAMSLTALYVTDTVFLTPFLAGTQTAVDLTFTNGADILELHCTDALFTKAPVTRGSSGWMEITVDATGVANTTDANTAGGGYSPVKATLTNTTATY